jgi:hypothetical protein
MKFDTPHIEGVNYGAELSTYDDSHTLWLNLDKIAEKVKLIIWW